MANSIKQYEFCDDLWREIKSYLFVPRTRGDKCDTCEKYWTKQYGVLECYVWWDKSGNAIHNHKKIPCDYNGFPYDVNVKSKKKCYVKYSCNNCWFLHIMETSNNMCIYSEFCDTFLERGGNTKKNRAITDSLFMKICYPEDNWLIKNHRLTSTRNLQKIAQEILSDLLEKSNLEIFETFCNIKHCMLTELEYYKIDICNTLWRPIFIEMRDRKNIQYFNQGKIDYIELKKRMNQINLSQTF